MKKQALRIENYFNASTQPKNNKLPGFTIVELLIVIVVIGILAAISIVAYNGMQIRATDSTTKFDAGSAGKQLELAKSETGVYPDNVDSLTKSPGTAFTYTKTDEGFELTVSAERKGTKAYCVSSGSLTSSEGKCTSHNDTAASCFTFNSSTGAITNYSILSSCPRNVIIPSEIEGRAVTSIGGWGFQRYSTNSQATPDKAGTVEDVPAKRLRKPWRNVTAYDTLMENWQRIDDADMTDTEKYAVDQVFRCGMSSKVAELIYRPVEKAVQVHDPHELEKLTGLTINDLRTEYENFHHDGDLILSPNAGLIIAEHVCRITPNSILARIIDEETAVRNRIKRGTNRFGDPAHSELRVYQEFDRPKHEL